MTPHAQPALRLCSVPTIDLHTPLFASGRGQAFGKIAYGLPGDREFQRPAFIFVFALIERAVQMGFEQHAVEVEAMLNLSRKRIKVIEQDAARIHLQADVMIGFFARSYEYLDA